MVVRVGYERRVKMADPVKQFVSLKIAEHVAGTKSLAETVTEIVEFMEEINKC